MSNDILDVDVCIATYKRRKLLTQTLRSLCNQSIPEIIFLSIIVVDNDKDASASETVRSISQSTNLDITYAIEPRKNIAHARNKALSLSKAKYVLFIDDDEVAHETWIVDHISSIEKYNADVVAGPVYPSYAASTPIWIIKGNFFERPSKIEGTVLRTAFTANTSITRVALSKCDIHFNPDYGITGGSDSEFFARLSVSGAKIVHSNRPRVFEHIADSRLSAKWLLLRGFRLGQVRSRVRMAHYSDFNPKIGAITNVLAIVAYSTLTVALLSFGKVRYMKPLIRVFMHLGMLSAFSGHYYEEYK